MTESNYIFQPFAPDADISSNFIARCINEAHRKGFLHRFSRINGGYKLDRFFYAHLDVTHLQRYSITDNSGQTITFTRLIACGQTKGYVIDYTQPHKTPKTN